MLPGDSVVLLLSTRSIFLLYFCTLQPAFGSSYVFLPHGTAGQHLDMFLAELPSRQMRLKLLACYTRDPRQSGVPQLPQFSPSEKVIALS